MRNFKGSLIIAIFTFFGAILVTLSSQSKVKYASLGSSIIILLIIIFIGIISDMVGFSATIADEKTFNARAAKKIFGAKEGLFLVQYADRVASIMCDIIGDICGTVSGAIGAIIVFRIADNWDSSVTIVNLISIGLIAAFTVGGKAFFKTYSLKKADDIIFNVGKLLASFFLVQRFILNKLRGGK